MLWVLWPCGTDSSLIGEVKSWFCSEWRWAEMQLFPYLSPAVSDASAKTKHHSFQHLISGKFGTLGDGWPWSFMEKMSNWQEVCKLRWQTALIVPQPKWVLCTCWVCLEPHFLPGTMSWPATLDTPHISHDLLWTFWIYIVLTGEVFQPSPGLFLWGPDSFSPNTCSYAACWSPVISLAKDRKVFLKYWSLLLGFYPAVLVCYLPPHLCRIHPIISLLASQVEPG